MSIINNSTIELKKYLVKRLKMLKDMSDSEIDGDDIRFYEGGIIEVESLWKNLIGEPLPSWKSIQAGLLADPPPESVN